MVLDLVSRNLAGSLGLAKNVEKVVPFRIAEQVLEVARQPIIDARFRLLCMSLERIGELNNNL